MYRVSFAAVLAMIVASIVSAFLGARVSAAWFASGTMTAIWALLIVVMAVGCAMSLHRRRGGGVLALHLGCLCVLVGGMMGSQRGGAVLNRLTGEDRLQEGSAALRAGERCDVASHDKVEYPLGFELRCERLYRTYYPPRGEGWSFYAARDGRAGGPEVRTPIRLEVDAELILPDGQTQLAVLDVIRPERYDAGPALLISTVHKTRVVAVDEGLSIPLNEPAGTVTIHEIDGESARVTLALEGREPVTERVGTTADVVRRRQLLGPGVLLALLPTKDGRPWREYPAPLVSVLLRRGERLGVQWLAPTSDAAQYELPLAGLFASPTEWREDGAPRLCSSGARRFATTAANLSRRGTGARSPGRSSRPTARCTSAGFTSISTPSSSRTTARWPCWNSSATAGCRRATWVSA